MSTPLIIDGRNLLDGDAVAAAGFAYEGVGRPSVGQPRRQPGIRRRRGSAAAD